MPGRSLAERLDLRARRRADGATTIAAKARGGGFGGVASPTLGTATVADGAEGVPGGGGERHGRERHEHVRGRHRERRRGGRHARDEEWARGADRASGEQPRGSSSSETPSAECASSSFSKSVKGAGRALGRCVTCPLRAGSRSPHAARAARRGARGRGDRGASSWNPHILFRDSDPPFESATRPVPSRVFPVSSVVGRDAEPRAREHASRVPRAPHATDGPRGARIQGGGALRDVRAREDVPRRARRRQDRGVARARPRRRRVPQAGAVRCDAVRAIPGRGGARLHAPQRRDGVASRQEHVHHVRLPRPAPPRRARLPAVQVRVRVDGTVQHRLPGHFRPLLVRAAGSAPPLRTPT